MQKGNKKKREGDEKSATDATAAEGSAEGEKKCREEKRNESIEKEVERKR